MANMIPISTVVVGSGGTSSIDFTNIPQNYTDLLIKLSLRSVRSGNVDDDINIKLNGSTSNFTYRYLRGTGAAASSSNGASGYIGASSTDFATASTFGNAEIYIPNYTSSNNKSISGDSVTENNGTTAFAFLHAVLWSNTAPITSINFVSGTSNNWTQYSSATLYGIRKY